MAFENHFFKSKQKIK